MFILIMVFSFFLASNGFRETHLEDHLNSHLIQTQTLNDSSLTMVQLLDKISGTVRSFSDTLSPIYPAAITVADSIIADLTFMKERWKKGTGDPAKYKKNLLVILKTFEIAGINYNSKQRIKLILNAYEDIHLKAEFCRENSVGPGEVVNVKVRTRKGTSEVPGWQVVYMLKIMQLADNPELFTLPKFSSPTSESLAPGIYRSWVQKPGTNITGTPVDIKVAKESEFDLPVPEEK